MKKKMLFPILVAFLSIALIAPLSIEVANAAFIFSDGFESGNLNEWTVTYGELSINSQTVNSGVYSVQSTLVGNTQNTYYQVLGASLPNPIYLREYVYINSTTVPSANGDYYQVSGFSTSAGGNYGDGEICVFNVAGTLYWGIYYRDVLSWNGFSHVISTDNTTSNATPVSIGWNCVELKHTTGTMSIRGEEQLFLNGVSIIEIDPWNYDRTPYSVTIAGSQHAANSTERWNYYLDDVVVSSSYIGPMLYQLTTSTNYGTISPASSLQESGSNVVVTATPPATVQGERYIWLGWIGSGVGSYSGLNNPASVTINDNITQTASWLHQYYLTASSAYGTAGGAGWYDNGTSAYATVPLVVAGAAGTQYVFTGWSGDASGTTSPSNPITMNGPKTATANWKTQYYLNVSSVNGTVGGYGWYDSGTNTTATLSSLTVAGAAGTRYVFTGWSGDASGTTSPSNPITVNGPKTATANWKTQYNLTLAQSGIDSDFSGNIITVNGTNYNRAGFTTWANSSDVFTFSYAPQLVVAANSKQYLVTGVSGNSSASVFAVSQPTTITGAYKTQYYLTTTSTYDSPSPANGWYDSGSSINAFVASPVSDGSGTQYVCTGWSGTGSVNTSGSSSAVTFTINATSTISWNWKTQYLVSFVVNPSGTTSPSGTNSWQDAGSISIYSTPSFNHKFSSWVSNTTAITFGNSYAGSTTATINGPGTITANFEVLPQATPTPTPRPTPSTSPSPSPTPTLSPSPSPTASPTPSPSQSQSGANITAYAVIGVVVALILVGTVTAVIVFRKRRKL